MGTFSDSIRGENHYPRHWKKNETPKKIKKETIVSKFKEAVKDFFTFEKKD